MNDMTEDNKDKNAENAALDKSANAAPAEGTAPAGEVSPVSEVKAGEGGAKSAATEGAADGAAKSEATEETKDLTLMESFKVLFLASRAFWLVNLVNFGDGIAYFGILTLLTRFLGTEIGLTDAMAGIAVSTFTGLVTLFVFGGGFVADKLGVRKAIIVSVAVIAVGRTLLALCPNMNGAGLYMVWVALFFMALGAGVMEPALYSGVKEFTDPRTASIGYGLLYSILNLGIVAENFLSPYLRSEDVFLSVGSLQITGLGLGIQGVFAICAGVTVLMLVIEMLFFTKKVEDHDRYVSKEAAEAEEAKTQGKKRHPFANLKFLFFIFILLPVRTLFAHQWLTLPDYVFRCYPESVAAKFEWITGLNPLIIVIFVPLFAALTRKVKVIDMMLIGTSVSALTTFILVPGPDLNRLIVYVTLFSLGEALWSSRFLEYVADLAPAGQVGAYMGLANLPWFLAKFTTGLYSGFMLEKFIPKNGAADSETLWLIYALIAMITPIGLLIARKWLMRIHSKEA